MAGLFERANEIAVLSGGRRAEWKALVAAEGAPTTDADGVAMGGALKTIVVFDLREDVGARRCRFTVVTLTFTNTYRVTINGTDADFDASVGAATLQDVLEGIRDTINTTSGVKNVVTATVTDEDGDGNDDTVLIVGKSENDFTIDHSVIGDTPPNNGDLASVADPTIGSIRIFAAVGGLSNNARPDSWRIIRDGEVIDIDFRGFIARLDTGSIDRIHVEAFDVANPGDGSAVGLRVPDLVIAPSKLP